MKGAGRGGDLGPPARLGPGPDAVAPLTDVAGLAGVAVRTGAVVLVRLRVHAGASVDARLVSAAVVEIWTGGGEIYEYTHRHIVTLKRNSCLS